jgi:8-oxo-dGTP diphosphatase
MSEYVSPPITIDGIVCRLIDNRLHILLVRRSHEPFKGEWALPGTYISREETMTAALTRTLKAKAGVRLKDMSLVEQLYTFDTPAVRHPNGHAISVVYYALSSPRAPMPKATGEHPTFFAVDALPAMAYQHADSVTYAIKRLRSKIMYTNAIFGLLADRFTLTELQAAYEAVLGKPLDKRNFRKKFLQLDLVEPTTEMLKEGAHRPARLYRFLQQKLVALSRNFE